MAAEDAGLLIGIREDFPSVVGETSGTSNGADAASRTFFFFNDNPTQRLPPVNDFPLFGNFRILQPDLPGHLSHTQNDILDEFFQTHPQHLKAFFDDLPIDPGGKIFLLPFF